MTETKQGLLLTGGGARAAYQVGALKAIAEFYPRNHGTPFKVITGTSAGAINSCAIACYASCFRLGVKKLEYIWNNFHANQVFQCRFDEISRHLLLTFLSKFQSPHVARQPVSLLNNKPLHQLLDRYLDMRRIDINIQRQHLDAISITASDYNNGDSISFFQGNQQLQEWQRARRSGLRTRLHPHHLLASSAIPLVFPCTQIGRDFYGDGSVHQLSPLSPAIHLGAEKILVIGAEQPPQTFKQGEVRQTPSGADIAGHLLDTIFTDTLNSDIERLSRINDTLSLTPTSQQSSLSMKPIGLFRVANEHDINAIADKYFHDLPITIRTLLRTIGVNQGSNSSITSYLMFEQNYTRELINLGYQDVLKQELELRAFLNI
ncbi:MAG: patatin [Moritella sp.]|uniref:patatin-like phospholipase family protein n=1 Tax=unclassified Moritella TaxID=2637987 RepID=UPI000156823F|nr:MULTISPECIES: patatin-like phospholipase family protein [unclassified Moritella]EDM67207.1 patatin-like phospholipase family protein [Moritella sp. PE36]MBL1418471.1 patatin-like phospholipase family protein [Moritella sp.]PHR88776.1 MAG: patatin [Moritella sp.]